VIILTEEEKEDRKVEDPRLLLGVGLVRVEKPELEKQKMIGGFSSEDPKERVESKPFSLFSTCTCSFT
jgi:hypothetical protein